jgi:hypothetical protein
MSVLIVVESQFGNTMAIARSIAAGIASTGAEVTVLRCGEAAPDIASDVELLLVGGPTHNLRLSSQASRTQAGVRGATGGDGRGLADWIGRVQPRPDLPVVAFDTTTGGRFVGSAAKAAVKLLRGRGFRKAEQGQTFIVDGTAGPLRDGEEERAQAWGAGFTVVRA